MRMLSPGVLRALVLAPAGARGPDRLNQEFPDNVTRDVGEAKVATLKPVGQLGVLAAHQVKDGRVEVVNVDRVLDDVVAKIELAAAKNPMSARSTRSVQALPWRRM